MIFWIPVPTDENEVVRMAVTAGVDAGIGNKNIWKRDESDRGSRGNVEFGFICTPAF